MGRPKGSKNKVSSKTFSLPPSEINEPKKIVARQEYQASIPRKRSIGGDKGLSGSNVYNSCGKDYGDALKNAEAWAKRNGKILIDYYEQVAFGKSVIVSYN